MKSLIMRPDAESKGMIVKKRTEQPVLSDVCFFSSFSFSGVVEEYVYYYLQELKNAGFSIVFISTSPLKEACIGRLSNYSFLIIERENKCPDFGSWKAGLSLLDWGQGLESVLLVNDSVFGPLFDIHRIISQMKKKYDIWGMTDSYEVNYHLQSYFLYFNKSAIASPVFAAFWKNVDLSASKEKVIYRYEVGLSVLFSDNNFSLGAYAAIDNLYKTAVHNHRVINPTLVFWKTLLEKHQFPFLKRELLIKMNITKTYWLVNLYTNISGWRRIIQRNTAYPLKYIEQFINNYHEVLKAGNSDIILKKRKILFLAHSAENDEGQTLLINFLRWLKKETTIEAEIIVCNNSNNNSKKVERGFAGLGIVTNLYAISNTGKQNLKERLADEIALIFSFTIENILTQKFLSFLDVPQIVFVHERPAVLNKCFSAETLGWLKKNISQFIAGTNTISQQLTDCMDISPEKISLVYKFVNLYNPAAFEKQQKECRSGSGIPLNAFVVGIYCNPDEKQPVDFLPFIAAKLCRNNNDIHIVWLYNGVTDTGYNSIYAGLAGAGLTERVHMVQNTDVSRAWFSVFNVFVMASREDIFPLIAIESGLAGKPVICFAGQQANEYTDLGTGITVPYLDIDALAEKIFAYYDNRNGLEVEKSILSQTVKEKFATSQQVPAILQIIRHYYDEQELMFKDEPTVTFLTHIYYENTWDEIRNKLKNFDNGKNHFLFSISEACLAQEQIAGDIEKSFKNAVSLITSNIGKDIGGKMALIDIYLLLNIKSSYTVFLHDKQSPQLITGELWKNGLFKIIDPNNQRAILTFFKDPAIGIIGDKNHIVNEYNPGTGDFNNNSQLSKKLLQQFEITIENYDFLGGTMYWIRSCIIERFFEKNHPVLMREHLEAGNVLDLHGERLAHTWERLFSWIAINEGFTIRGI